MTGTKAKDVLDKIKTEYGDKLVSDGVELIDRPRLSTGVFAFDLATGGGFPMGRISILYGTESSLKSTLSLLALGRMQKMNPEARCVLFDTEHTYDPKWGAMLGVDNTALIKVLPDYAEQAVDLIEAFIYAEDVSMVVVDSLAAFIPIHEVQNSAEKATVGSAGLIISKMYRKATLALSHAERDGHPPVVLFINQIRHKIGTMYGNPETMPGGNAPKFMSSLTVRLYGKDEMDKTVHATLPTWKVCTGTIHKSKVPITAKSFEFKLCLLPNPQAGLKPGQTDDWSTLLKQLKDGGFLAKVNKGWQLFDETYKNLEAVRQSVMWDPDRLDYAKQAIISAKVSGEA